MQALVNMRDEGVVSAEEFEAERRRILADASPPSSGAPSATAHRS